MKYTKEKEINLWNIHKKTKELSIKYTGISYIIFYIYWMVKYNKQWINLIIIKYLIMQLILSLIQFIANQFVEILL